MCFWKMRKYCGIHLLKLASYLVVLLSMLLTIYFTVDIFISKPVEPSNEDEPCVQNEHNLCKPENSVKDTSTVNLTRMKSYYFPNGSRALYGQSSRLSFTEQRKKPTVPPKTTVAPKPTGALTSKTSKRKTTNNSNHSNSNPDGILIVGHIISWFSEILGMLALVKEKPNLLIPLLICYIFWFIVMIVRAVEKLIIHEYPEAIVSGLALVILWFFASIIDSYYTELDAKLRRRTEMQSILEAPQEHSSSSSSTNSHQFVDEEKEEEEKEGEGEEEEEEQQQQQEQEEGQGQEEGEGE